jgi:hypothetical protein
MQPSPIAETMGPDVPSLRCSMMILLVFGGVVLRRNDEADMRRLGRCDKLDNPKSLVQYIEQ